MYSATIPESPVAKIEIFKRREKLIAFTDLIYKFQHQTNNKAPLMYAPASKNPKPKFGTS